MENIKVQQGPVEAVPEEVGFDHTRIDALNRHLQKLIDTNILIGSSYCISRKGKIIGCGALGFDNYHKNEGQIMKPDTIMSIASVTKLFTTVAIFQLVEEGFIRPDEPLSKYLSQFKKDGYSEITIAQLLSHTSGLWPDGGCFPNEKNVWEIIETLKPGDDWLEAATQMEPRRKPGEEWMYSSFGFVVLGYLIEKISGENSSDYIMNHIVKPLGMEETGFKPQGAMLEKFLIQNDWIETRAKEYIEALEKGSEPIQEPSIWDTIPVTGGGIFSNVLDLIKFGKMLCNGGRLGNVRILGRMSVEKMSEQYLHHVPNYCWGAKDKARLYGLGPDLRRGEAIITSDKFFFHEGSGALCLTVDPKEELTAAWMVPYSSEEGWYPEALLNVKNVIWSGIM